MMLKGPSNAFRAPVFIYVLRRLKDGQTNSVGMTAIAVCSPMLLGRQHSKHKPDNINFKTQARNADHQLELRGVK